MKPHKISALLVNHSISCKMKLDDTMSKYKKALFKWEIIRKIRLYTLFESENERQKIEQVPIPLPRASRNCPDIKTRNNFFFS